MMNLQSYTVPPVSREFFDELKRAFPRIDIKPGTERDNIMWNAGQQYLLDWIEKKAVVKRTVETTLPDNTPETTSWFSKLFK